MFISVIEVGQNIDPMVTKHGGLSYLLYETYMMTDQEYALNHCL